MASYPPASQHQRRQRRSNRPGLANLSPPTLAVSAAVAAYGTYRLASWAWDAWHRGGIEEEEEGGQRRRQQEEEWEDGIPEGEFGDDKSDRNERDADASGRGRQRRGAQPQAGDAVPPPRPRADRGPGSLRQRRQARQIRLARCRTEILQALADFLPTLKSTIEAATDFAEETRELKRIRTARAARARAGARDETGGVAALEEALESVDERVRREEEEEEEEEERRRERHLWNVVKVRSVSRLIATAYGHTILLLVLTVQVNLLGGRLFSEEMNELEEAGRERIDGRQTQERQKAEEINVPEQQQASEEEMAESATSSLGFASRTGPPGSNHRESIQSIDEAPHHPFQSTHRTVLTRTYHHLFASGIASLVATVESAAKDALSEFDVTDADRMNITPREFGEVLGEVRDVVEGRARGRRRVGRDGNRAGRNRSRLIKYVVQPDRDTGGNIRTTEDEGDDSVDAAAAAADPTAEHILEETWDILESPHYEAAERDCLDATFAMMKDGGWGGAFAVLAGEHDHEAGATGGGGGGGGSRPLAQVLAQLRRTANGFYGSGGGGGGGGSATATATAVNAYVPALVRLPSVVELGDVSFD